MPGICYIAGAGDSAGMELHPEPGDLVIAADGGAAALDAAGIAPDVAVGDFDSLGYVPENVELRRHPPEKDDTDMMLSIKTGLERGFDRFIIHGSLGGRLDHTLANIQCLAFIASQGGRGWLWGGGTAVTVIRDGRAVFPGKCRGIISVFACGGAAEGVYERGLKYRLDDAVVRPDCPIGVSNEFTGAPAEVSVRQGMLAILWQSTAAGLEEMVRKDNC